MITYQEYLAHAKEHNFQPLSEETFNALLKAGFNPITTTFLFN